MAIGMIRKLEREVMGQPEVLERFSVVDIPKAPRGSIFVGAGDSYAAALAAFYSSFGSCLALDPYTLASAPEFARGLQVYFISVSGRTRSNLSAMKKAEGLAKELIAITADESSPLGKMADATVRLPFEYVPKMPGLLSFSLSLMASLKISGRNARCNFTRALKGARKDARSMLSGRGTTFFLGSGLAYPVALYAAAKRYEILGARAQAELIEEFSHMELFSLTKADAVNAFSCFDPLGLSAKIVSSLVGSGYHAVSLPRRGADDAEGLFRAVFTTQLSALWEAEAARLSAPKFLASKKRLAISDSMIY